MTQDIYSPPVAEPLPAEPMDRKRGRKLAAWGIGLLSMTLVGIGATVLSMLAAFGTLAGSGEADPAVLADDISASLIATVLGSLVGLVGGVFCAVAVFGNGNRERWFIRSGMTLSCIHLFVFPLGTLIGVVLIVGFIMRWKEFKPAH